jgi:hypothetical protein
LIEYNHELSQELRDRAEYLRNVLNEVLKHKPKKKTLKKSDVIETELGPKSNGNGKAPTVPAPRPRKQAAKAS